MEKDAPSGFLRWILKQSELKRCQHEEMGRGMKHPRGNGVGVEAPLKAPSRKGRGSGRPEGNGVVGGRLPRASSQAKASRRIERLRAGWMQWRGLPDALRLGALAWRQGFRGRRPMAGYGLA